MTLPEYLAAVDKLYRDGRATEHSYRGDLQRLLSALLKSEQDTNEPRRIACGAQDYIHTKGTLVSALLAARSEQWRQQWIRSHCPEGGDSTRGNEKAPTEAGAKFSLRLIALL